MFNLSLVPHNGDDGTMAVWDGTTFLYQESKGWSWLDYVHMFWR